MFLKFNKLFLIFFKCNLFKAFKIVKFVFVVLCLFNFYIKKVFKFFNLNEV